MIGFLERGDRRRSLADKCIKYPKPTGLIACGLFQLHNRDAIMRHRILGRFVYDADNKRWRAFYPFKHLLRFALPDQRTIESIDARSVEGLTREAHTALDALKGRMRDQFGPDVEELIAALEAEAEKPANEDDESRAEDGMDADEEDEVETPEQRAVWRRDEARMKQEETQKREGNMPIVFDTDARKSKPTFEQRATLQDLLENEAEIAKFVMEALFESYRQYYSDKRWREMCKLPNIKKPKDLTRVCHLIHAVVTREHWDGFAYLLFPVDCIWEIEHGMFVVYHPTRGTDWATGDSLSDLLESEGSIEDAEELPPNQELLDAIYADDEIRVKELIAQGHDINALGETDPYPPLCGAVEQMDVDLVRRLLAAGANPELRDPHGKTPVQIAKRMLKDTLPKEGNKLMQVAMSLARKLNPGAFEEIENKIAEITRLLEEAETRGSA